MKKYSVKDGKMHIELSKNLSPAALDSFMVQFNLHDLGLERLFQKQLADSLEQQGWQVEMAGNLFVISKSLLGSVNVANSLEKLRMTEKVLGPEASAAANHQVKYAVNKFRNKAPFTVKDSVVTFYLKGNPQARKVYLAGSFNTWSEDNLAMHKTDSGWVANLKLSPGKHWYKFVVDGNWTTDRDNQIWEDDGHGNVNSVFFVPNHLFSLKGFLNARKVFLAGSFNEWRERELAMVKTAEGWQLPLYLNQGTHSYKFIVDGKWYQDVANAEKLPDENGGFNSVVRRGASHVFTLDGFPQAQKVVLSGSFNNWKEHELFMRKTATGWELPYTLGPGNHEYKFIVDGQWMADPKNLPPGHARDGNSLLVFQPNYTFVFKNRPQAKRVSVAGDFNNWNPEGNPMRKVGNDWQLPVFLPMGKNRYKFIVDGEWILDPANPLWEQNEYRTGNSILWLESKQ
ncbi:hypothetical protein GU926_01455 [Nibribacter ruber]|uniref:AMP-activated protein kinase glycogen-binding domain-containing protein n=1 Tax=Nibribacter ruber TaxID=2698458 RepID=A0A6P1NZ52_9BACT|nr:hypothetical protein [Nibribacter ruber]QHL86183.1 hypothetical protein GU926_01455 [Nibribacter ruber]